MNEFEAGRYISRCESEIKAQAVALIGELYPKGVVDDVAIVGWKDLNTETYSVEVVEVKYPLDQVCYNLAWDEKPSFTIKACVLMSMPGWLFKKSHTIEFKHTHLNNIKKAYNLPISDFKKQYPDVDVFSYIKKPYKEYIDAINRREITINETDDKISLVDPIRNYTLTYSKNKDNWCWDASNIWSHTEMSGIHYTVNILRATIHNEEIELKRQALVEKYCG